MKASTQTTTAKTSSGYTTSTTNAPATARITRTGKVLPASAQERRRYSSSGGTVPLGWRRPRIPLRKMTTAKCRKNTALYSTNARVPWA